MKIPAENVRNFVILGHGGCGKTLLADAIACELGLTERKNGLPITISDFAEEEKARGISVFSIPYASTFETDGAKYRLVYTDTPGAPGFYGQMRGAVRAADSAVIVIDAVSGVQSGTRRAWRVCRSHGLAAIAFAITGLDKEHADVKKAIASIRAAFGKACAPITVPINGKFENILDCGELPDELGEVKIQLAETAAETDENLMNEYFENGMLDASKIRAGLHAGIEEGEVHPIYCVNPAKGEGVREMLSSICRLLPPPGHRKFIGVQGEAIGADPEGPLVGQVWKMSFDPFLGSLCYLRVYSGTIKPGQNVRNASNPDAGSETIAALSLPVGRKALQLEEAGPGEIVAIPKLKNVHIGDTLTTGEGAPVMMPIDFPEPVTWAAIKAASQSDDDKLGVALKRLADCDPTLKCEKNVETKQLLIKGIGDVHLELAVSLLKSQSNVSVTLSDPEVPYRETIVGKGEGHCKYKKQSGGHGQYAEVFLKVEPMELEQTDGFVNEIKGGVIPGGYIPAVQKGVEEAMLAGPLAGYPVQQVRSILYFGSYHEVDSSEMAFKTAARTAFKEGMLAARAVLLEPVMSVTVTVPDACLGAVTGDMPHKRGRLVGMEANEDGEQVVTAEVPLSEMFHYTAELRSLTGGQGEYTMTLLRYERVPEAVAEKIIASKKQ